MNTDEIEREIGAMQLSDSFFPTGIFATSSGLEYLFSKNRIKGSADLLGLIRVCIAQQLGPSDCVAMIDALDNASKKDIDGILEADEAVFATKPVKEVREALVRSGVQLVRCVAEFVKDDVLDQYKIRISQGKACGVFPVAFGVCCNALHIEREKGMTMMLYGFAVSVVGAALRLGMIQHLESQKIIHDIKPVISHTVKEFSGGSLRDMWQFAPQMDVIQMSHEKMDSKMFIT